jgi:hypothetical protein
MSMMRNSAVALAVVSALAFGATSASAGGASHETKVKKNTSVHMKQDRRVSDAGWQQRDPVTGIVRGTGEFVGGVVAGTGAFVSSAVSGQPYGAYYSEPYGVDARFRVGANAPAGFSGCATDEGSGRYRECESGATGG